MYLDQDLGSICPFQVLLLTSVKPVCERRSGQRASSPLLPQLLTLEFFAQFGNKSFACVIIVALFSDKSCLHGILLTLVRCLGPGLPNLLCKKLFLAARFLIRKARFSEPVFGILKNKRLFTILFQELAKILWNRGIVPHPCLL